MLTLSLLRKCPLQLKKPHALQGGDEEISSKEMSRNDAEKDNVEASVIRRKIQSL